MSTLLDRAWRWVLIRGLTRPTSTGSVDPAGQWCRFGVRPGVLQVAVGFAPPRKGSSMASVTVFVRRGLRRGRGRGRGPIVVASLLARGRGLAVRVVLVAGLA